MAAQSGAFAKGRLLVRFRDSVSSEQAKTVLRSVQANSVDEIRGIGVHVVQLPPNASEAAYENAFRQRADVEFVELDRLRTLEQTAMAVNDPYFTSEWHLTRINAPAAWSITTGSPSIIIAIADTGVNSAHPDLASKMVSGWNTADNNSNSADVHGHGTQVAGTTAAATNNGIGVASIARNCWIMPIRVSQLDGAAYHSAIASGITWAADHGARVVNVSYDVTDSATVSAAARYMHNKGGVVTVSAGNYSKFDTIPDDPYILTVGATDANDVKYSWSDYGNDIDVVAPGCVYTTTNTGSYSGACGTSFSAPVVAGVAALVMSAKPSLSAAQVTSILRSSADDFGTAGWDTTFGAGRVNAAKAVNAVAATATDTQAPAVSFMAPAAGSTLSGTVAVQVSATDNVGVTAVTVTANGKTIGNSSSFSWNTTAWANGTYTLIATVKDAAGNTSTASRSVTLSNIGDRIAPVVAIAAPVAGAILSGPATLGVITTDNVRVVKVEYFSDGAPIGTVTTAPFQHKWNVRKVTPGVHTLQAKAYDAAGNIGVSAAIQITIR